MQLGKIKSNTIAVMLIIVCSKLLGMARDVVLAYCFGTSPISDAYLIAISVPTLLFFVIGNGLSTAYLPIYNQIWHNKGLKEADRYSNNLTGAALVVCTVLVIVLVVFPEIVVRLFAAGFDAETISLAAGLIRVSAVGLYFMTFVHIWSSYLQAHSNYIIPAAISVPRNLVIIVSVVVAAATTRLGYLGVGILIAYMAECLLLFPFVLKNGYRIKLSLCLDDPKIQETIYLVLPVILSTSVSRINKIIDKSIASTLVEGGVSVLSYASTLNGAVQEILVTGIITILFANCSTLVAEGKYAQVKERLSKTVYMQLALIIPASAGVLLLAEPIVKVILCRGSFDEVSLNMTAAALRCYTIGLVFLALRDTFVKMMYAYKDSRTAMRSSAIAVGTNIALNFVFSKFFGLNGLAIATSFAACIEFIILFVYFNKKYLKMDIKRLICVAVRVLISTCIMSVVVYIVHSLAMLNGASDGLNLLLSVICGILIYAGACLLLNFKFFVRELELAPKKKNEN